MNRAKIKALYRELYTEVEEILFRNDPMGINFEDNTDEYDPEVDTILPRLKQAKSEKDVQDIVYEEFVRWFEDSAGNKNHERYKNSAKEIWGVWVKFNNRLAT